MRSHLVVALVAALVLGVGGGSTAQATSGGGPLALDLTYGGGDGSVQVGYPSLWIYPQRMAPSDEGAVVAKSAMLGGGSGEMGLALSLIDGRGAGTAGTYARFTSDVGAPSVVDVIATDTLTFVVGWHWAYDDPSFPNDGYGYVAAFPADLTGYADWGSELFAEGREDWSPFTGLERLQEFDLETVTAGGIDRRGRVLVAGVIDGQAAVVRLTTEGIVDRSFGEDGVARYPIGASSMPADLAVGRGSLLVGSTSTGAGGSVGFALKLTSAGHRDNQWGDYGLILLDRGDSVLRAAQPTPHGGALVGLEDDDGSAVIRLDPAGVPKTRFGNQGEVRVPCIGSLTSMSTWSVQGELRRIAVTLSCDSASGIEQKAAMWRPNGQSITALQPDGLGALPYRQATLDTFFTGSGQLMALTPKYLYRMG